MIEELKDTTILNKIGGRFKLSALIQKRMIELMEGGRPLIEDTEGMTSMEIVVEETVRARSCWKRRSCRHPRKKRQTLVYTCKMLNVKCKMRVAPSSKLAKDAILNIIFARA